MESAIKQTKRIISSAYLHTNIKYDPSYKPFYWFTNENVAAYLKEINATSNQRALSVLASGDQAFNLIAKGIKVIDTFDINELTEYYVFGLKLAIITKYNYEDFCEIYSKLLDCKTTSKEITDIIYDLLPLMDRKYRRYWREIIDFYLKSDNKSIYKSNLVHILSIEGQSFYWAKQLNIYLQNESNYKKFKTELQHANISFVRTNATELPEKFNQKYDYLLLSNILDYIHFNWGYDWTINDLTRYLKKLKPMMNKNALIFLHYCFNGSKPFGCANDISFSNFEKDEILTFKGKYSNKHAMILKRVNSTEFLKRNYR